MEIRDLKPEDIDELKRIHDEMGFDYQFPDLDSPLFIVKKVMVEDNKIVAASVCKIQAEVYLWLDPDQTAKEKVDRMKELNVSIQTEAWIKGVDQLVAYLPPGIEKRFQKRLNQMGWMKDRGGWDPWSILI